ncbi:SusC/RagA family TonB-linked outer membrane protein [Membranihabitans maritimus]|uniref:SusC/RagA family TonB-linked outer membrane protein n=1 Tax=Membranihabitans maritimus TaxID=2904244 RepID=UPI001F191810|nr:SusC/RagA family TonB-linked outer membrane protein [Membranihabitans maritimus]
MKILDFRGYPDILIFGSPLHKTRFWMRMSITLVTVLLLGLQILTANEVYSQKLREVTVTLDVKNTDIREVFKMIENQTRYRFAYNPNHIRSHSVSIEHRSFDLKEALDSIFKGTTMRYEVVNDKILVYDQVLRMSSRPAPIIVRNMDFEKLHMKKPVLTVSGIVKDANGEPLIGVNVLVRGTNRGTSTDFEGHFTLEDVDEQAVLIISYIGYQTQEIPIAGKSEITITLLEDSQTLDEVVVVGYGTQKKATLTGSVADVKGETLNKNPGTNLSNSLSGLLPGIITRSSSGEPGRDNALVLVRGRNTTGSTGPLVVVDGIQGFPGWQRISREDIESITVLKDASAAIYGARAANGVILITTKRGKVEDKPLISYSFNQGISTPTRIPELASSATYAGYVNQLDVEKGTDPRYTQEEIEKFRNGTDPNYLNVDWYGEVLKSATPQSNHNLNLRGGSETVQYSVSGTYSHENSLFKEGSLDFKSYSLFSNLDFKINEYLDVGIDVNSIYQNGNYPTAGTSTTFAALRQLPLYPVYWANGLPSAGIERGENPIVMSSALSGNENEKNQNNILKGSFNFQIPWLEGLALDGYYAYTKNSQYEKNWRTPWTVYDYDVTNDEYIPRLGGGISNPELTQYQGGYERNLINLRVKYDVDLDRHQINTFVAVEQEVTRENNFSAKRINFLSSSIDELFAGSLADQVTDGVSDKFGRKNLFGRINYSFDEKYLLDFNYRYDGSSAFPEGRQFGFFPGLSVGWRLSEETFMSTFQNLDNLKLRFSAGKIGNDAISAFQYLRTYNLGNTGVPFGADFVPDLGLVSGVVPNPNITWEEANLTNLGVDVSFWGGELGFVVDVFKQRRTNILTRRDLSVPGFTGFELPLENIGVVENKGIEFQVNHQKHTKTFSYRLGANIAYARNKIIDIDEAQNVPDWQKAEGHILGAELLYESLGIIRTQEQLESLPLYPGTRIGDLYYKDQNGDGVISASDRVRTDRTNVPEITFGFNAGMEYKDFTLFMNFAGATNFWQRFRHYASEGLSTLEDLLSNRYTEGSMDSKYPRLPRLSSQSEPSGIPSTFWQRNASYLKLRNVELSYTLPVSLLNAIGFESLDVYINGSNLLTIDKLKWADPEATGDLANSYPQSRVFNVGFNLTF